MTKTKTQSMNKHIETKKKSNNFCHGDYIKTVKVKKKLILINKIIC